MTGALAQQVAVVSGASGGIGGAIATALVAQGANVCLVGRNADKLDALARSLRTASNHIEPHVADLTRDEDIAALVAQVRQTHGRLDVLVHSAGAIAHGKLESAPVSALDEQYAGNVRGLYVLTQSLLPLLKQPRGQIVFINSSAGLSARPNAGQYSAMQHAVKALADAWRDEINGAGVRVLSVYPGRTATPRIAALHVSEGRPYVPEVLLQPDDVASVVVNALTLPWTAEVTNIHIRPMLKSY